MMETKILQPYHAHLQQLTLQGKDRWKERPRKKEELVAEPSLVVWAHVNSTV